MTRGILGFFKTRFLGDRPLHPVDRRLAKTWIKNRLVRLYPELQTDPTALERAYQALNLEARSPDRQNVPCFEMTLPFADRE